MTDRSAIDAASVVLVKLMSPSKSVAHSWLARRFSDGFDPDHRGKVMSALLPLSNKST